MLRTRLFLNLLPFVAILLATGVYAMVLFSRLAANVNIIVTDNYRSVMAAQAILEFKRQASLKCLEIVPEALAQILRVNSLCPTVS